MINKNIYKNIYKKQIGGKIAEFNSVDAVELDECNLFDTKQLTNLQINCKNQTGINSIQLNKKSFKIHYNYTCIDNDIAPTYENKSTPINEYGEGYTLYLENHNIDCNNRPITNITLNKNNDKINYNYTCGDIKLQNIIDKKTNNTELNYYNNELDKHLIKCDGEQLLTQVKLNSFQNSEGKYFINYSYKCGLGLPIDIKPTDLPIKPTDPLIKPTDLPGSSLPFALYNTIVAGFSFEIARDLFKFIEINGDGNCLFRSLSYYKYGTQEKYKQIRNEITNSMNEKYDKLKLTEMPTSMDDKRIRKVDSGNMKKHNNIQEFIEEFNKNLLTKKLYIDNMSNDTVWGTDNEIQEFSEINKIVIIVLISDNLNNYTIHCGNIFGINNYNLTQNVCFILNSGAPPESGKIYSTSLLHYSYLDFNLKDQLTNLITNLISDCPMLQP